MLIQRYTMRCVYRSNVPLIQVQDQNIQGLARCSPGCMSRKWHDKRATAHGMFPRKIDERRLAVGLVLLLGFVRSSPSTCVLVATGSPGARMCTPHILDATERTLLIELLYFDSTTISRAPDLSSLSEVELRVCGVRLARPIPCSAGAQGP